MNYKQLQSLLKVPICLLNIWVVKCDVRTDVCAELLILFGMIICADRSRIFSAFVCYINIPCVSWIPISGKCECWHRFYTYKGLAMRITTVEQSLLWSRELNCYVMMSGKWRMQLFVTVNTIIAFPNAEKSWNSYSKPIS